MKKPSTKKPAARKIERAPAVSNSPKLTQKEAETLAEAEGFRSAMEEDTAETVTFLALLEYIAEAPTDNDRYQVYCAAFRGAAPIFRETEQAVEKMRGAALADWRKRRAGAGK